MLSPQKDHVHANTEQGTTLFCVHSDRQRIRKQAVVYIFKPLIRQHNHLYCYYIHISPEDGGCMFIVNAGIYLQAHAALQPTRPNTEIFTILRTSNLIYPHYDYNIRNQ
jgi:hypothetical protein